MPPSTEILRDERTNNTLRVQEIIARDLLPKMRHDQAVDRQIHRERHIRLRMDPFNGAVMRVLPREENTSTSSVGRTVLRARCSRCGVLKNWSGEWEKQRAHHDREHPGQRFRRWRGVWVPA